MTLLQQTNIESKIKLVNMKKTWEYTRFSSMIFRYIETLFYIIISCTENLTYLSMIYSMYTNAGLITMFYPMVLFGYALLNEVRPNYKFWRMVLTYSIIILTVKFICSLQAIRDELKKDDLKYWVNFLQLGIVEHD